MTTVVLWTQKRNPFLTTELFGKPVWRRTLEACRVVSPRRVVWLGTGVPKEFEELGGTKLGQLDPLRAIRGTLLLVPAGASCIGAGSLRRLLKKSRSGPHALFRADGGEPVVIALDGSVVRKMKLRSLDDVMRRLKPAPLFVEPDELLVVDSGAALCDAHWELRMRKIGALIKKGVLIPDPTSVSIAPEVTVGGGTVLSPFVVLDGDTRVGTSCAVGSFSHLVNATVGTGTTILDHCFVRDSRIGKRASIGPFAHLRPESDVGDTARVGNFVELKKSKLGAGAKAPHLTYVGDATIGKNANLGAGTITCNYDGKVKSRTVVGDGAFIGSDVQLVAPVRVGKGAFVAAGSCIVKDVPPGALALARSHQIIKKGWAKNRKKS